MVSVRGHARATVRVRARVRVRSRGRGRANLLPLDAAHPRVPPVLDGVVRAAWRELSDLGYG